MGGWCHGEDSSFSEEKEAKRLLSVEAVVGDGQVLWQHGTT
jgi:hypothetical protein